MIHRTGVADIQKLERGTGADPTGDVTGCCLTTGGVPAAESDGACRLLVTVLPLGGAVVTG